MWKTLIFHNRSNVHFCFQRASLKLQKLLISHLSLLILPLNTEECFHKKHTEILKHYVMQNDMKIYQMYLLKLLNAILFNFLMCDLPLSFSQCFLHYCYFNQTLNLFSLFGHDPTSCAEYIQKRMKVSPAKNLNHFI